VAKLGFREAVEWLLGYSVVTAVSVAQPIANNEKPKRDIKTLDRDSYLASMAHTHANGYRNLSRLLRYLYSVSADKDWLATFELYRCGYDLQSNMELFPYFDRHGNLCTVKLMRYGFNGHRQKDSERGECPPVLTKKDERFNTTFFGGHLIDHPQTLYVVESEKTALICATLQPYNDNGVWVATGGKGRLSKALFDEWSEDLTNTLIVLCPDSEQSTTAEWHDVGAQLVASGYSNVECLEVQELYPDSKMDLADIELSLLIQQKRILSPSNSDTSPKVTNTSPKESTPVREDLNSVFGVHDYLLRTNSGYALLCNTLDLQPIAIDRV
jgi:hypothetical protein